MSMCTVSETAMFQKWAAAVWSVAELDEFRVWIANNPLVGDVVQGSGGLRKVRWAASGRGKRGGARVIYFHVRHEQIWLLMVYTKAKFDNLPTGFLVQLRKEVQDD